MQVTANMANPGILSVLRKPPVPKSGSLSAPGYKIADLGQSKAQAEPRQSASAGRGSGGSGGVLGGQDRLDIRGSTLSENMWYRLTDHRESRHRIRLTEHREGRHRI